ncbi:MAG: phosphate acyltransferase PlsX [Gammaproteobacteria bacterium]
MGGDIGPKVTIPAALQALKKLKNLHIILVGQEHVLNRYLKHLKAQDNPRLSIQNASETVGMDESPAHALRTKKDSSMRVSVNLVKQGSAHACVSAGNTGALMATARFVLKTLPGIDRPAIISALPTDNGCTYVLDLGANVDSGPEHLLQFAVMGSILVQAAANIPSPKIGLLNIGEEDIKGNELVKQAAELIAKEGDVNYYGYVEGNDIFNGVVDVVVCDGFVGNVALKTCEGVARLIAGIIKKAFAKNIFTKFCGLFAFPVLHSVKKTISPERYNGASLLGLNGIVVKSHGSAKVKGLFYAIEEAVIEVEKDVPQKIRKHLEQKIDLEAINNAVQ